MMLIVNSMLHVISKHLMLNFISVRFPLSCGEQIKTFAACASDVEHQAIFRSHVL